MANKLILNHSVVGAECLAEREIMPTKIISELKKLFESNNLKFIEDNGHKWWNGEKYYTLKRNTRINYLAHIDEVRSDDEAEGYIEMLVPKNTSIEDILSKYGLAVIASPNNKSCSGPYRVRIVLKNDLLDGQYTVDDKKSFFIDMAKRR
jgi:hypothetical protein